MKRVLLLISITIICLFIAGGVLADPPANDSCANAYDLGTLVSGSTVQHSGNLEEATMDCGESDGAEVWVKFTITSCMDVTIDYCDEGYRDDDACRYLFAVCPCDDETYRDNTDYCESNYNPIYTWLDLEAGTYYYPIWASLMGGDEYTINVTAVDCPAAPDNDDCADAVAIGEVTDQAFSTRGATFDGEGICLSSPNIWFVYTASFTGDARITVSADFGSQYAVYNGSSCSSLPSELGCTTSSELDFAVVSGQLYLIEIGGTDDEEAGDGSFTIAEAPEAAANDNCANATDAGTLEAGVEVIMSGNVIDATQDCEMTYGPEVWIKFTITECMDVTIDFCDDENHVDEAFYYLYDGCPCEGNYSVSDYGTCENYNISLTWYNLAAGTYYYPIIADFISHAETYTVSVTGENCPAAPENDNCSDAIAVGEVTDHEFNTRGASFDGEGECVTSPNIWYIYTSSFTGSARISVSADYDNQYAVYDGAGCSPLPEQIDCTRSSRMDFSVVAGQQYLIEIGGRNNLVGSGFFTIAETPEPPANDNCENATDAGTLESNITVPISGNVAEATKDCGASYSDEVWIQFTLSEAMSVTIDFCDNSYEVEYECPYLFGVCPCSDEYMVDGYDNCINGSIIYIWDELAAGTYYYPVWAAYLGDYTYTVNITGVSTGGDAYPYLPGDANMAAEAWPAQTIGGDVTYLVNYFRGLADPCYLDGFYASADATGDCLVVGGDVTYLVNYFRGLADMSYCSDYEPAWPTPSEVPTDAPDGWPNCD